MAFKNIADQTNGFYIPCVSLFGPGCAKEIGSKAQNLGAKKALIVTDEGLFKFGVAHTIAGIKASKHTMKMAVTLLYL